MLRADVGFQGEPGAFSEEAIAQRFPGATTCGFPTFEAVAQALTSGVIRFAALPYENSIFGPIDAVAQIVRHWNLREAGRFEHRIVQALIGTHDATLEGITSVRSHPVALAQCRRFLAALGDVRIEDAADTAGAVREIVALGDRRYAAVGPARAAERYAARILVPSIADLAENITRFCLIARKSSNASEHFAEAAYV